MTLHDCLPAELRGPDTTITRVSAGLSGAGVHRVDAGGRTFALKVSDERRTLDAWREKVLIQRLAADAGVGPRVIHVDEARRAVVSEFVVDRSFPAFYFDPRTRDAAIALLGRTMRRAHAIPLPPLTDGRSPREFLATIWPDVPAGFAMPAFARDAIEMALATESPESGRAMVLSHNDTNPSNLLFDGERLLLVDWDTAGPNDPFYDLAVLSLFIRMDEATCRQLLAAYDDREVTTLPARFLHDRRIAAALCGAMFLLMASRGGHPGATTPDTIDSTPSLAECYGRMRAGEMNIATPEGQWWLGLALLKQGFALDAPATAGRGAA